MVYIIANKGHAHHDHGRHEGTPTREEKDELLVLPEGAEGVVDLLEVHHVFLRGRVALGQFHGGGFYFTRGGRRVLRALYAPPSLSFSCPLVG